MRWLLLGGILFGVLGSARAGNVEKAKEHYEAGLGAYALGRYAEAAEEYEKAFALKPDPALLYNAAQAHRLAGNKQRALLLYGNLLRLFGPKLQNRDEVQKHIAALTEAIDSEARARHQPPIEPQAVPPPPEPAPAAATPASKAPAAATPTGTNADLTARPPPARKRTPGWVWGVVGGSIAVAIGAGLGLGLGLGLPRQDPEARFGVAKVQ